MHAKLSLNAAVQFLILIKNDRLDLFILNKSFFLHK